MAKKKNAVHVVMVLDETGSMGVIKGKTISGFNEYITTLQGDKTAKYRFTLTTFNSESTVTRHAGTDIQMVDKLTHSTYTPTNLTPLYDAIGIALRDAGSYLEKNERGLLVIFTDGQENASREFTRQHVADKIKDLEATGRWGVIYLGANQDSFEAGQQVGVNLTANWTYGTAQKVIGAMGVGTIAYSAAPTTDSAKEAFASAVRSAAAKGDN